MEHPHVDELWVSRYAPRQSSQIVGNQESIAFIRKWLKGFPTAPNSSIIICGPHGVGKSIAIKLLLAESEYDVKYISSVTLKQTKSIKEIMQPNASNLAAILEDKRRTSKQAIIIDDSETITLTSEKNLLIQLFKENESKKMAPIIFLTNEQHSKLVSDIKKSCPEVRFKHPHPHDVLDFVRDVCSKEELRIADDATLINITKFSQLDIRRLLVILQDLKHTFGDATIGLDEWRKYVSSSQRKDKDIGLFEATLKILDSYKNMDTCLQLYETEKVLLPLMVFENYPRNVIMRNVPKQSDLLFMMKEVTNSISLGDVIETNIYTDQNWYLQNLHGFYTCVDTSFIINRYPRKSNDHYNIDFSSDLNKTSLKNINKKNIISVQSLLKHKNLTDLLFLNKLIHSCASNEKFAYLKKLAVKYQLPWKTMEIIMKIDKSLPKINLTTKNKRMIQP